MLCVYVMLCILSWYLMFKHVNSGVHYTDLEYCGVLQHWMSI